MAEDRQERPSNGNPLRTTAPRSCGDTGPRTPDLDLLYDLADVLAHARSVQSMAPALLQLLVDRLGFAAAELSVQEDDASESPPSHWLVRGMLAAAPAGCASEPIPHASEPYCSSDLTLSIDGKGRAVLRTYSLASERLAEAEERFLRSLGQQIAQFVEARNNAEKLEVMAARQVVLLDAAREAAFTIDARGRVLTLNSTAEAVFGLSAASAVGSDLVDLIVSREGRKDVRAAIQHFRASRGRDAVERALHARAVRRDQTEFAASFGLTRMDPYGALPLTVLVSDVSRRDADARRLKVYQERLRSLTADLLLVEERERRQLALDLHDGLSQTIALVKMRIVALEIGASRAQSRSLHEIGLLIEQANKAARSVSFELSPPVLHDFGLEPALEWLAENISARYGIQVVFEDDTRSKPTDERTRIILFRSIRELLINAAKHSRAKTVKVELERVGNDVQATVVDDGVGMEPALEEAPGSGLFSIRERLRYVGGDMSILSAPGRGTSIQLRAHVANEAPDELAPRFTRDVRHSTQNTRSATYSSELDTSQGERS